MTNCTRCHELGHLLSVNGSSGTLDGVGTIKGALLYVEVGPMPGSGKRNRAAGMGSAHRTQRQHLLRAHVDGTPCELCGRPMYRDDHRNHDGLPLHADHVRKRMDGGTKATRLLHGSCNSRDGALAMQERKRQERAQQRIDDVSRETSSNVNVSRETSSVVDPQTGLLVLAHLQMQM